MTQVKTSRKKRAGASANDAVRGAREPAARSRILRIIAGRHRGRRLRFPAGVAIRPTPDRVRETLFNWLQPRIAGARVLDLFAGSGALGLEAVSRGAAHAVLVEHDRELAASLRALAGRLEGGDAIEVVQADALAWLHGQPDGAFDLAFVDPPFDANLWGGVLPALAPKLAAAGWLYVEAPAEGTPALPHDWVLHREGRTREVRYALYRRVTLAPDSNADGAATE